MARKKTKETKAIEEIIDKQKDDSLVKETGMQLLDLSVNEQKSNYIFPNFLANLMSKVDQRTQYESSMLSMTFMAVGIIVTAVYMTFYTNFALWYKIFLDLNFLAGLLFMSSYLVTTFAQYQTLMSVLKFQEEVQKLPEFELARENSGKGGPE